MCPSPRSKDKNSCGHFAQTHRVELFLEYALVSSCTESATGPDISGIQSCKNKDDSGVSLQITGAEWHPFQADPSTPSSVNLGSSKFQVFLSTLISTSTLKQCLRDEPWISEFVRKTACEMLKMEVGSE